MTALAISNTTATTLPEEDDPWLALANEGGSQFGKLIKFAKGEWTHKDGPVAIGAEFVVLMPQAMRGWVRFADGRPADYRLGYIRDGAKFVDRAELGFTNRDEWPRDKRGEPTDPWQRQYYLPLMHAESGELYTWVFSSHGAKQAFRDLGRAYSPYRKTAKLPVVSLQTSSYRHETFGKIDIPVLKVERFDDSHLDQLAPALAPRSSVDDMNDSIPF
jgi:hypothetical protein